MRHLRLYEDMNTGQIDKIVELIDIYVNEIDDLLNSDVISDVKRELKDFAVNYKGDNPEVQYLSGSLKTFVLYDIRKARTNLIKMIETLKKIRNYG